MPELTPKGPDIPEEVLNALRDNQLVLFCGAGISMATGLPNFDGLVKSVRKELGLDADEYQFHNSNNLSLDKQLMLMEEQLPAPSIMRREVVKLLSKDIPKEECLITHRALLDLSKIDSGDYRMITTNFDNRFDKAAEALNVGVDIDIEIAPRLSVPKPLKWKSLAYLHGKITDSDKTGASLILTSSDFGQAYLTDRWASRFVTELLRNFHVLLVGYSVGDPVLGYILDAVAAEKSKGGDYGRVWAFAPYDRGEQQKQKLIWESKSVTPIMYPGDNNHELLNKTLVQWAEDKKNPIKSRINYAVEGMRENPISENSDTAKRVVWALLDGTGKTSEHLYLEVVFGNPADYQKMREWIDVFDKKGLLDGTATGLLVSNEQGQPALTPVAGNWYEMAGPPSLPKVTRNLSNWLARHLHVPQVLEWVVKKGGILHSDFMWNVLLNLREENERLPAIPAELRRQWMLLCAYGQSVPRHSEVHIGMFERLFYGHEDADLATDKLAVGAFLNMLTPRLAAKPGMLDSIERILEPDKRVLPLRDRADIRFEVACATRDINHMLEHSSIQKIAAPEFAWTLTSMLFDYFRLLELIGTASKHYDYTQMHRPSIADHSQNSDHEGYIFLLVLARDSYFRLAESDRKQADTLRRLWATYPYPVFKRLFLHAVTENIDVPADEAVELLLEDSSLWQPNLHRETMRFLRVAGKRISSQSMQKLENAILAGSAREIYRKDLGNVRGDWIWNDSVWKRLTNLDKGGVKLSDKAQARMKEAGEGKTYNWENDRDDFRSWSESFVGLTPREEDAMAEMLKRLRDAPFDELPQLIQECETSKMVGIVDYGDANRRALLMHYKEKPARVIRALRRLACAQKEWPVGVCTAIMHHSEHLSKRGKRFILKLLPMSPDDFLREVILDAMRYVKEHHAILNTESVYKDFLPRLWENTGDRESDLIRLGVLTQAINTPSGVFSEIILLDLGQQHSQAGTGIPDELKPYFNLVAEGNRPADVFGRALFACKLSLLYSVDRKWCEEFLLPKMDWFSPDESQKLWSAFSWSARVTPNLASSPAFQKGFFSALRKLGSEEEHHIRLAEILASVCASDSSIFDTGEVKSAIKEMIPKFRAGLIRYFANGARGADEENRAAVWAEKAGPFLKKYWPTTREHQSAETAEALASLIANVGDSFPDAWEWGKYYVRPIKYLGYILRPMKEAGLYGKYPEEALAFLRKAIDANDGHWSLDDLKKALEEIKRSRPKLEGSADFVSLSRQC